MTDSHDEALRVVIIEDHAMVAEALAAALDREPDIHVAGTANDMAGGLHMVRRHAPHVVLMDYRLPDGTGAEATRVITREAPDTRVVILTSAEEQDVMVSAITAGCAGFLHKSRRIDEVLMAVRAAHAGEALFTPALLASIIGRLNAPPDARPGELTPRELEILSLLGEGCTTDHIAEHLVLSVHTVRNHVRNITAKLGAHSRLEAVSIAAREGIIELGTTSKDTSTLPPAASQDPHRRR